VSALHPVRGIVAVVILALPTVAFAQQSRSSTPARSDARPSSNANESKSAELATQLAQMLDAKKITSIAAPQADHYVGALYMPGVQLLVVTGKFASGERMDYLIAQKSYREAYQDLNSASDRSTKILISDLGANGLHFRSKKDQPFDIVDVHGKSLSFDGKWGGKELPSREEYRKMYEMTDERYTQMLQALIEALKKSS
jgi:hypothetical protein